LSESKISNVLYKMSDGQSQRGVEGLIFDGHDAARDRPTDPRRRADAREKGRRRGKKKSEKAGCALSRNETTPIQKFGLVEKVRRTVTF
jgi:hypothetical protein